MSQAAELPAEAEPVENPRSALRRAWALITGFYLATMLACGAVLLWQMDVQGRTDRAERSAKALQTATVVWHQLNPLTVSALTDYLTKLREIAPQQGWWQVELRDKAGVVVGAVSPSRSRWSERLVAGWEGTSAMASLDWKNAPFGDLHVWVMPQDTPGLVERCLLAVAACFVLLGGAMIAALARLVHGVQAPLADFQEQVLALSERRFVALKQPSVAEWVSLSKSLNVMVARVRGMLEERDRALDALEGRLAHDDLTHTASRPQFMQRLGELLKADDGGCAAILRVHDLEGMNRRVGRGRTDEFLVGLATTLRARLMLDGDADEFVVARLNGADFGLLRSGGVTTDWRARLMGLADALHVLAEDGLSDGQHVAWIGGTTFLHGESPSDVLLRLDAMVMAAESHQRPVEVAEPSAPRHIVAVAQWRVLVETALDTGRVALARFPVVDAQGRAMHEEAMVRLVDGEGRWMEADDLVPPAIRNGRIVNLDLRAIELALAALGHDSAPAELAVNVAAQSLRRPIFLRSLGIVLERHREVAGRLCLEIAEDGVHGPSLVPAQGLYRTVAPYGCRLGIDHFGITLSTLPWLHAIPIDYVKLSPQLLEGLQGNARMQGFISVIASLGERLGVPIIATGVATPAERTMLRGLGVSGFSGPLVTSEASAEAPTGQPA
jgi:EAL domain-containing protein (putative c-di-GMP-specific phosphodiesterase class I)/GGDEF domain-containing protein